MAGAKPKFDNMPGGVAEIFAALVGDVFNLCLNWDALCDLFGRGPERLAVLNRFAAQFFTQVRNALLSDVLLRICRLTEPAVTGRDKENQTLHRLLRGIEAHDPALLGALQLPAKMKQLTDVVRDMRAIRNRSLAHKDWGLRSTPLPSTTKDRIDEAVALIKEIMNAVERHFEDRTTHYNFAGNPGDAKCLAGHLEELGRRHDKNLEAWGVPSPRKAEGG